MDMFTDSLSRHWGSREMINANRQAEAEEMRRMQEEMEEYRRILDDMKVMTANNAELAERMVKIADSMSLVSPSEAAPAEVDTTALKAELSAELQTILATQLGSMEERLKAMEESMGTRFTQSEENNHRENVKVFRNVQAVVVDELKAQTTELEAENRSLQKKVKKCKGVITATLVFTILSFVYNIVASIGLIDSLVDWVEGLF